MRIVVESPVGTGLARLRAGLRSPLPASVRDPLERIAAWSTGAAAGDPDAQKWVRAASADLLAVVLGRTLLPATQTLACRALRLADLVREVNPPCATPGKSASP